MKRRVAKAVVAPKLVEAGRPLDAAHASEGGEVLAPHWYGKRMENPARFRRVTKRRRRS